MSVADFLLALSQQFETDSITLQPAACLNARFRTAGCTYCTDICPAEAAITVIEGRPAINNDTCLHCGLCLHRCPTGAFTRPDGFSRKLTRTAAIPNGPVELICPQSPNLVVGATPYAVQTRRCLAAISAATLLELAAAGKDIWLDDSHCAACLLGVAQPTIAHTAAEANGWAALLANAGTIYLRSERPDAPVTPRQLLDATQPPVSRRGLFGVFKPQAAPAADTQTEAAELIKPGRSISPSERLPYSLPPERAAILNILAQHAGAVPEPVPLAEAKLPVVTVQVDAHRCTACGLCAKFCPTGAIKFISNGQVFALAFRPNICLGQVCNICQPACPEQAVTTIPVCVSPDVLTERPLVAGDLTRCARCKTPLAQGPDLPTTCFACRPKTIASGLSIWQER